jgi:hypothetical protein
MRIQQVHISNHVKFFTKQFCELWGLREYDNVNDPALFLGCYDHREIEIIKAHRGFKLVMPTGEDSSCAFAPEDDVHILNTPFIRIPADQNSAVNSRMLNIPVKDFRTFKPVPLGDKIYCYQGHDNENCKRKYNYGLLKELMQELGEDKFLIGYQGHTPEEMIEKFYKPSFINLQLNEFAGFSSTLEMAAMGRVSVCNGPAPFCIKHDGTAEDIISFIKFWSPGKNTDFAIDIVAPEVNNFLHYSDNWLNTEYWQ